MVKLIAFVNAFCSYLLVFVIFVALILAGVFIGIKLRKNKDAKQIQE